MNPDKPTVKAHREPWRVEDGWHTSHGFNLLVREGKVVKADIPLEDGKSKDGCIFVFQRGYGWVNVSGLRSFSSVSHGLKAGKYRIA